MKIAIGSDHGGIHLKKVLMDHLAARSVEFTDMGTYTEESCDYPDFAVKVCDEVVAGRADRGILVCGTGIGMSMAANKVHGIRAALCSDVFSAKMSREHNNANVLCLGERVTGPGLAEMMLDVWLDTEFAGGRHERRVRKIMAIEK
ncbi:MAG: Allose-6-phosphate isomerase / ribose-5-phosphate isomerase B [Succiniclasticum sp.]|jgi:ribose 5-phosphate isomerase B